MTPESEFAIRSLGTYMRHAARMLHESNPITSSDVHKNAIKSGSIDVPYMMAVLLRLEARGIAKRVLVGGGYAHYDLGFIRGPNWLAAAHMYKWYEGNGDLPPVDPNATIKEITGG